MPDLSDLAPEDAKLVTLARTTRARAAAAEGAAVRDLDGRTFAAASVDLPHLRLSAVGGCVAMAVAAGSRGLEAAVVLGEAPVSDADLAVLADLAGPDVPVLSGDPRGTITSRSATTEPA